MRFFSLLTFFCIVLFAGGCTTSRVIEDTRTRPSTSFALVKDESPPDIVIDKFGDVSFQGKRIAPEDVATVVAAAGIPKKQKIRILVPEQRDHVLMRIIADNLLRAGYGVLFITDTKEKSIAGKKPVTPQSGIRRYEK